METENLKLQQRTKLQTYVGNVNNGNIFRGRLFEKLYRSRIASHRNAFGRRRRRRQAKSRSGK